MKLDLKQILLYAIVPALVAGFFSIAPKAYEVLFETKASLEFAITTGPKIAAEGSVQQVISVRITNSGKKPLTAITAELSVPDATILASSVENTSGLAIDQKKMDAKIIVQLPKALPGETFSISALVKSTTAAVAPTFVVRSDEVLGRLSEPVTPKNDLRLTLLGALGATLSVLLMAVYGLFTIRRIGLPSKKIPIMYITLACQDGNLTAAVQKEGEEISYMQFADMLLAHGRASVETRGRAVAGLKCLLTIEHMAEQSQAVVRRNFEQLASESELAEIKMVTKHFPLPEIEGLEFRDYVDGMFVAKDPSPA